jgi:maleate cis-trans isomerase
MYGWRGLVGWINPTYRGRIIHELYRMLPEGVGLIPCTLGISRGERDVFSAGFDRTEAIIKDLAVWGADVVTQPGIPPWLVKGREFEQAWVRRVEAETGVRVVTPMGAAVQAFRALGSQRIVMATYFAEELNSSMANYFRAEGIEVVHMDGFKLSDEREGMYTTPLVALNRVGPSDVYRFVRGLCAQAGPYDGVFVLGGGWDAWETIAVLERDLECPVVFSVSAPLWACLRNIGVKEAVHGHGRLLEL